MNVVKHGLALVVVCAMAMPAQADRLKVAVVPGIAVNLDSARVDALGQDLADALMSELDIDAVGGLEVRRKLPAEGLPPDCLTTPSCVGDVSQRLGAQQLLFVVMVDATGSGAVQVDSTWVDVNLGKSASRPAIDLPAIADAKTRFAGAAKTLLPDAPVKVRVTPGGGSSSIGRMTPEIPRHMTTPAYITAGAAVVGLGFGIGFALSARSRYNRCDAPMACSKDDQDSVRTKTIIADVGFLVGIGGIVATGILFATSGKESRLVVSPTPGGVALSASGRF